MKYNQWKEKIRQSKKKTRRTTNQEADLKEEVEDNDDEILMFHSKTPKQGNTQQPIKKIQKKITITLPPHIRKEGANTNMDIQPNIQSTTTGITNFDITPERGAAALRHLKAAHQS
jgi:hypothetical protein